MINTGRRLLITTAIGVVLATTGYAPAYAHFAAAQSPSYLPDSPYASKRSRTAPRPFNSGDAPQKVYVPSSLSGVAAPSAVPILPVAPVQPVDAPASPAPQPMPSLPIPPLTNDSAPLVSTLPRPVLQPLYPNRGAGSVSPATAFEPATAEPVAIEPVYHAPAPIAASPAPLSAPVSSQLPPPPSMMPDYKPYATLETQQSAPLDTRHYEVPATAQLPQEPTAPLPPPVFAPTPASELPPAPPITPVAQPAMAEPPITPIAAEPMPVPAAPVEPSETAQAMPEAGLSDETRRILERLPGQLAPEPKASGGNISVKRVDPNVESALSARAEDDVQTYEAAGLSVQVRQPRFNSDYELEKAYNALIAGETEIAIEIYRDILAQSPNDQQALFGLATTYHRIGALDEARPLYGRLLSINPDHREALNNFLVLVAEESPQEALRQLDLLEQKNPDYSPIPAQMAILYDKLGHPEEARQKMIRAANLSPENLVYTYNLAILLDRQDRHSDAASLYRKLLAAERKGQSIPANVDDIQKRLTFIGSN